MTTYRSMTLAGLLSVLPIATWFLASIDGLVLAEAIQPIADDVFRLQIVLQLVVMILFLPRLAVGDWGRAVWSGLLVIAVPWPFVAVLGLAGAESPLTLAGAQLALVAAVGALVVFSRIGMRLLPHDMHRFAGPMTQGLATVLLTVSLGPWLGGVTS